LVLKNQKVYIVVLPLANSHNTGGKMVMANGLFKGVSSRTTRVNSSYFYGRDAPSTTTPSDLIPEGAPFNNSSISMFPLSYGFKNKCSAQTRPELMDFRVSYTDIGNYAVFSTSGNRTAFHKEDIQERGFAHIWDEDKDRMDGWIGATLGSHAIEYVKKPTGESGLYESQEFIRDYSKDCPSMTNVNVPIASWSGVNMDINKVGEYVSRIANLEQDLRDVIFYDYPKVPRYNSETEAVLESLISKGKDPRRKINAIGVENLEKAIAITYYTNETANLVASADIYQKALRIAENNGLKGEEAVRFAKRALWYHELFHVFDHRKFVSRGKKEIDVGEFLAEFFAKRAGIVDEKTARYYRALAKENEDYAKGWRKGRIKNLIESLAKQYASEAQAMGMSEEEARDYVANKLEGEIKNLGKSELEEVVDEENKEIEDGENKAEVAENKECSGKGASGKDSPKEGENAQEASNNAPAE